MTNGQSSKKIVSSIENASILRKFTILFLLMSIIPTCILYYFYVQLRDEGQIFITEQNFNITLTIVVIGVMVGYLSMRSVLKQVVDLLNANRKALETFLTPERIRDLATGKNEVAVLAQSFTEITGRLEENIKSLELAKKTLHSILSKVGHGISNMNNIDTFLGLILETVTQALNGNVGILMLMQEDKKNLEINSVYGIPVEFPEKALIPIESKGTVEQVIQTKKAVVFSEPFAKLVASSSYSYLFTPPLICAPLIVRDGVKGLIVICGAEERQFDDEAVSLLQNLSSQMAVAIENSHLSENMEKTYFETISALALAVDAKDSYSRGHLDRVAYYCVQIANRLGLDDEEIKTLRDATRLHDLGKIGIPDEVLGKKGPLNHQEWLLMRKHPEIGESIIKPIRSLSHLCDIIRHHHEKLDGSGYPDGLKGEEIAPLVRITTIADIYDALTSKRSYRRQLTRHEACDELRKMKEKIDQDIVEVFAEALEADEAASNTHSNF